MVTSQTNRVITCLHRVAFLQERGGVTDAQLLERFLARGEEIAFEELLRRHGPMVLGVCRRVLGDSHDVADAFQATFLVLIRQAASIVPRSRVGPWLYGVARRTALKARSSVARRRRAERDAVRGRPHATPPADTGGDLRPLLDEELGRLPEKYRAALVLCMLEGKSRKEAAGLLGWTEGTLSGRLARAKTLLGDRLKRRGVAIAGAALATALAESAAGAEVPASLVVTTARAAAALAGSAVANAVSIPVAALTEEVVKAMLISKLKAVVGVLVLVVGIGLGAGVVTWRCGPAVWGAAPAEAGADAKGQAAPEKKAWVKPRADVIGPPDILLVEYAPTDGADPVKIAGQHLVRPDGTIGLGQLGSVFISGRTSAEAHGAIAVHLARRLDGFDPKKLTVAVVAQNSKVYYVIAEWAAGGEEVYRFPATGSESVLDALGGARVKLIGLGQKRIYVQRMSDDGKSSRVLSVDWEAITKRGDAATNHLLLPGDRVYIKSPAAKRVESSPRTDAVKGAGPDPVRELEAVTKAFREARTHEERRRLVEELDAVLKTLREQLKNAEDARHP
jgi:polysaccharide biosynthesis/export protein